MSLRAHFAKQSDCVANHLRVRKQIASAIAPSPRTLFAMTALSFLLKEMCGSAVVETLPNNILAATFETHAESTEKHNNFFLSVPRVFA